MWRAEFDRGIIPIIAESHDDSGVLAELIDHMISQRVDAIIILGARRQDTDLIESATRIVPVVVATRPLLDVSVPVIMVDDRHGGALVADHFASLGHKLVAQLVGPSQVMNFPLRDQGFSRAAKRNRLRQISVGAKLRCPPSKRGIGS